MEQEQILFVLRNGEISQWNLSCGQLAVTTIHGQREVEYSPLTAKAYWDEWKEDGNVVDSDVFDTIFLSDTPDGFGELPKWIYADSKKESAWTFEQLALLAGERDFTEKDLCIVQGKNKRLICAAAAGPALTLYLKSSLAFVLPKEATKQKAAEPKEAKKTAAARKVSDIEAPIEPPSSNVFAGDSYNDSDALLLKVGDKVNCTVASVRSVRGCCYLKSDRASELIRVKLPPVNKKPSSKAVVFVVGMKLVAEVIAVKDKVVEYKIAI